MTHEPSDPADFTDEQKALLRSYFGASPLDEKRVARTVQAAREYAHGLRTQRRRKPWTIAASTLFAATLFAAGFWRWSGEDSDELSFEQAIRISKGTETHMGGNRQAAAGRLWRLVKRSIDELKRTNGLTDEMRFQLLEAATSEHAIAQEYRGLFRPLALKLEAGKPLSSQETEELTKMLRAGIHAMRVAAHHSDSLRVVSNVHRLRLLRLLGVEDPSAHLSWGR